MITLLRSMRSGDLLAEDGEHGAWVGRPVAADIARGLLAGEVLNWEGREDVDLPEDSPLWGDLIPLDRRELSELASQA
jgi:hypothetical protein